MIERYGDKFDFRVDVGRSDIIHLRDYEGKRLLEDDIIHFVGEADGLHSYSAIFGNRVTIPALKPQSTEGIDLVKIART